MRTVLTTTLLAALLMSASVASSDGGDIELSLSTSRWFGSTRYEMSALAEDPTDTDELVDIRSELEFPLDVTLIGAELAWSPRAGALSRWSLTCAARTNLVDPAGVMTDEDWVGDTQLAYTESGAAAEVIAVSTDLGYALRESGRLAWSALLHIDYQRVEQRLEGYEGWRGTLFSDERYEVSGTAPVIDYEVTYLSAGLGGRVRWSPTEHVLLSGRTSVGVARASDRDDHLLRGRISEGSGWGIGAGSRVEMELLPGSLPLDSLSLALAGELRYFLTEGTADQRWYRDEDMPAGTVISGLPHRIESLQFEISGSVGLTF